MSTGDGVAMDDTVLRERLKKILSELETDWQKRPANTDEEEQVVSKLQQVNEPYDYERKLVIAGFLDRPYSDEKTLMEQKCGTCVRYVSSTMRCALPELDLPVEPDWSCVLWRA